MAHAEAGLPPAAERLLMIPDLCHNALCGSSTGETTNASTTELLEHRTRRLGRGDLRASRPAAGADAAARGRPGTEPRRASRRTCVTSLQPSGDRPSSSRRRMTRRALSPERRFTPRWAFISSGTWSLVGRRTHRAARSTRAVLAANFTNERGVDGTFRFLKNVAGPVDSGVLPPRVAAQQESMQTLPRLIEGAAALSRPAGFVVSGRAAVLQSPEHGRRAAQRR